ncbi:hypothetical protein [Kordiimonas sp.]|uniref:hypothetical protein n=1 Tax=Kordiimonas sp. TaxID=1970157 RepID=UPI003B51D234
MEKFSSVLTTVNAPHLKQLDADGLVRCLQDEEYAMAHIGHVWSFFGEVPVSTQLAFALHHSIAAKALQDIGKFYAKRTGADFPILHIAL